MKTNVGTKFEIAAVDGKTLRYRDTEAIALEAAQYLKSKNPNVEVVVRNIESGALVVIKNAP